MIAVWDSGEHSLGLEQDIEQHFCQKNICASTSCRYRCTGDKATHHREAVLSGTAWRVTGGRGDDGGAVRGTGKAGLGSACTGHAGRRG